MALSDWSDEHSDYCLLCGGVYSCLLAVYICTWGEAFQHLTGTIADAGGAHAPICRKTLRNAPKTTQTPARGARTTACAHPSFSPWQAPGPRRISCYFSPPQGFLSGSRGPSRVLFLRCTPGDTTLSEIWQPLVLPKVGT